MVRKGRILIVDDEKDIRLLIREILEDEGYDVSDSPHSEAAFSHIAQHGMPDLVVLDIWLENSDKDGMEILAELKKREATLPVLMISGHGNIEMAVSAIKLGAFDFIEKPFNTDRLLHLVERAMEAGQLKKAGGRTRVQLESDVPDMQAAIKAAHKAALGDGRVMIMGDAGCGRNHLARFIHQESGRSALSFVSVRANGVDVDGFEKAVGRAGQGTLVLRDVAKLSADVQRALLRHVSGKTECRIIVSAHPGFSATEAGFLPDLYERLAVNVITLPALGARRADIARLSLGFVQEHMQKWGREDVVVTLNDDALTLLQKFRFTGHMAELQAMCTVAAFRLMQDGGTELKAEYFTPANEGTAPQDLSENSMLQEWLAQDLRGSREAFERWYFDNLSLRFDGNISAMASFAGMDRTALHRKLKSLKDDADRMAS